MYYIRMRKNSSVIGDTYCCVGITEKIKDIYEYKLKEAAKEKEINIYINGEWIDAEEYFYNNEEDNEEDIEEDNKQRKTKIEADIEVVKNDNEDNEDNEEDIEEEDKENDKKEDYSNLFEGQWRSQVKNIKEYTDDINELEKIIKYANNNDVLDAVLTRIKDYKEELE